MAFGGALAKFKSLDQQGIAIKEGPGSGSSADSASRPSALGLGASGKFHQSAISSLRLVTAGLLSTSAYDGRLIMWNLKALVNRVKLGAL